jgi:hypothetical protein
VKKEKTRAKSCGRIFRPATIIYMMMEEGQKE